MMGGRQWVSNVLLVSVLFCGPLLAVFSVLNTIAWVQGSTQALPFGTICIIIVIWALVTFPLTVLGGIAGKNSKDEFSAPCRWEAAARSSAAKHQLQSSRDEAAVELKNSSNPRIHVRRNLHVSTLTKDMPVSDRVHQ
jgi:hypothetical protein